MRIKTTRLRWPPRTTRQFDPTFCQRLAAQVVATSSTSLLSRVGLPLPSSAEPLPLAGGDLASCLADIMPSAASPVPTVPFAVPAAPSLAATPLPTWSSRSVQTAFILRSCGWQGSKRVRSLTTTRNRSSQTFSRTPLGIITRCSRTLVCVMFSLVASRFRTSCILRIFPVVPWYTCIVVLKCEIQMFHHSAWVLPGGGRRLVTLPRLSRHWPSRHSEPRGPRAKAGLGHTRTTCCSLRNKIQLNCNNRLSFT